MVLVCNIGDNCRGTIDLKRESIVLLVNLSLIFQLPGSPAELDGRLQKGDLLVSVDGKDLTSADLMTAATAFKLCGNKVAVKVKRFKPVR